MLDGERRALCTGDLFVVPSWVPWSLEAGRELNLFRFSDAPVVGKLRYDRTWRSSVR